jgi:membrane protein YdbS with pleckstrin-like domain
MPDSKADPDARSKAAEFRAEVLDKMSSLATAAFGLVAALAWNNAIQALFKRYYPAPDDPSALWPLVGYALLVTLVAVLIILAIGRAAARLKGRAGRSAA